MNQSLRILVACEFSGTVRRAFATLGHDAWSCDLLPAEDRSNKHIVGDVREVIVEGLSIAPVRNRYKVFIIDEVHMLSTNSFNALLKSIEEPPPHVVFMMATTELEKVPATIQSRSQVFELKMIGLKQIADQLRAIATAEGITIDDAALSAVHSMVPSTWAPQAICSVR